MKIETIKEHISARNTFLYCILDGATVLDLPQQLFKYDLPNFCLFGGDLESNLADVAPYIIRVPVEHEFTEWVLKEGFGDDWGIFVHARQCLIEMRRHFRGIANCYDEHGNSRVFRFYDPRVLREFLPTYTPKELTAFFGNVDAFFAEAENGENLIRFDLNDNVLTQTVLN